MQVKAHCKIALLATTPLYLGEFMGKKDDNPNKKPVAAATFAVFLIMLGAVLSFVSYITPIIKDNDEWFVPAICISGFLIFVGVILVAVSVDKLSRLGESKKDGSAATPTEISFDNASVSYLSSQEEYELVNGNKVQTVEEKFEQISKMDKTQFVLYVANLFSRKGYSVKLTPVTNNHDIDMIVDKMGVKFAVSVFLTGRILTDRDLFKVVAGQRHYNVINGMALTNMYFDRSAVDYAKSQKLSLVDRNVFARDFMNS